MHIGGAVDDMSELAGAVLHTLDTAPTIHAQTLRIPVGDLRHLEMVEAGTVLVVLGAAMWVGWQIVKASQKLAGAHRRIKGE